MKKNKANHSQILAELLHKCAKSELREMHREMMDSVKHNAEKQQRYLDALAYVGIDWLTIQRQPRDDRDYRATGPANDIILKKGQ